MKLKRHTWIDAQRHQHRHMSTKEQEPLRAAEQKCRMWWCPDVCMCVLVFTLVCFCVFFVHVGVHVCNMCACSEVCAYWYLCSHVFMHVSMSLCVCSEVCVCVCVYAYVCLGIFVCVGVCPYLCVCVLCVCVVCPVCVHLSVQLMSYLLLHWFCLAHAPNCSSLRTSPSAFSSERL